MVKIAVYNYRADEKVFFDRFQAKYGVEIVPIFEGPALATVEKAAGCECISLTSDVYVSAQMIDAYVALGIKFISSRTIGLDHVDVEYASSQGVGVANVSYSIDGVAETAVMLMLMTLRKIRQIMLRTAANDFTLPGNRGRDLSKCTVGVIGTGKIGQRVIENLQGFGSEILAYDPYANQSGELNYVELDYLLAHSDVITLHVPATQANYHLIDEAALAKMKEGAIIINTSRGPLVDSKALISYLESGHIAGAGLDVIEGDREIFYRDFRTKTVGHHELAILNSMANVTIFPHVAFFTEQAVSDMVELSIKSCKEYFEQ